jgi:hypothetical protein
MIFDWINKDSQTINEFIHWGNTLKLDFTEKEFLNYRSAVMSWLSNYWQKKGNQELSNQYFMKLVDIINLDGDPVHVDTNTDNVRHRFRQAQLASILSILLEYKTNTTLFQTTVLSCVSIVIALGGLIISFFKN